MEIQKYKEMTLEELGSVLEKTIKNDYQNKVIAFLCMLSAYTENSQFNVSFNSPSSTGKSYIPTEIAKLFPKEDLMELGHCSPMAFFHLVREKDKPADFKTTLDLSRKIIIFLDQPSNELLTKLRPMLSHDKKEIESFITDRTQKSGQRSKEIKIIGFPAVIFCSTGYRIDEQESTRFFLLSPEVNQDKLKNSLNNTIQFESLGSNYKNAIYSEADYTLLKNRIADIKKEGIDDIVIRDTELIEKRFTNNNLFLKPRHNRDIKRLISLIKTIALLNLWFREKSYDGKTIFVNEEDVENGFKLWELTQENQDLGVSPYILDIFKNIIYQIHNEKVYSSDKGMTRQDIKNKYFKVYSKPIADYQLRIEILPLLETAGLIYQSDDKEDKRKKLIYIDENYEDPLFSKLIRSHCNNR